MIIDKIIRTNINIYNKENTNGYKNINILGLTNNNNNSFLFTDQIDDTIVIKYYFETQNNILCVIVFKISKDFSLI